MTKEENYRFFFSYARANHENATWSQFGETGNHLEQFYIDLCHEVSDLCGADSEKVGFHDKDRLKLSDFWSPALVDALQNSNVLISIISPHYINSENCGREFEFFNQRLQTFHSDSTKLAKSHRIIPIFWTDIQNCSKNTNRKIVDEIRQLQLTDGEMPENYPVKGLKQFCNLGNGGYKILCHSIAQRIVELSNSEPLPKLDFSGNFTDLPSAFHQEKEKEISIAKGPSATNVFYIVGTKQEMEKEGEITEGYSDTAENWCPFSDAPGATVEMATKEGHNLADQIDYQNHGFPEGFRKIIDKAGKGNSPVLLVLDNRSIGIPRLKKAIKEYDQHNYGHVGLVTAGGEKNMDRVKDVFRFYYQNQPKNHLWAIPRDRQHYVDSVKNTLIDLKNSIQQTGITENPFLGADVPGLIGPK